MAAVLLRSVARKMSRAAAPKHYHPSLVARGLHGGARSGPADSMAGLRSGAGWLTTTKMAQTPPPPSYHRLVHGRGIHSRASRDPIIPSSLQKVFDDIDIDKALEKGTASFAYIALFSAAIYMHYWIKPKVDELTATCEALRKRTSHCNIQQDETLIAPASGPGNKTQKVMHSDENRVKLLEAKIKNLEAEIAELKDSARS